MSGRGGRGRGRGSVGGRGRGRGRGRGDSSGRGGDRPRGGFSGRGANTNRAPIGLEVSPQSVMDTTVKFDDEVIFERITPEQLSATKIKLLNSVSSSLIKEPRFNDKESITHIINQLVKKVAFYDPEFILKLAVYTRDDLNIRSTSNYLVSLASNVKQCQPFLKKYFKTIVRLPSDWLDVAATYQALPDKYLKEKSLPTSLRKAMVEKFPDFDVYQLGKYNKERSIKRKNKKAKDSGNERKSDKPTLTIKHMIRQLHMSDPIFNVMCILGKKYPATEDEYKRLGLPASFDPTKAGKRMKLPVSETWETMLSEKGNRASTWEELIEHNKLPFMAMLRNIRNLIFTGVHPRYHKWVMNKLTNENAVSNSRQFPTRFFSAYEVIPKDLEDFKKQLEDQNKPKTITIATEGSTEKKTFEKRPKKALNPAHNPNPNLFNDYRKALDTAVKLATIHNIKPIRGSTVVFCNASAEMNTLCNTAKNMGALNKLNEVGVLLGLMCKYACEECDFRVFSSPSDAHPKGHLAVDITDGSILENVQTAIKQAGNLGTGAQFPFNYLEDLIREKKKIDNLIVLSHETIAPGKKETMGDDSNTISNILKKYRQEVNKDLLFVSVDLSGKGVSVLENDAEKHPNDILVSGFTDSILRFIAERGDSNQLQYVENIDIAKGIASKKRNKSLAHFDELDKLEDSSEEVITHAPHPKWKTARIFISSTFLDMHAERDILTRHVFPELRERCKKINVHLAEVDLRWGVTEEETQQNKSVQICLEEIDNCRPFFVGLLGNRYGWIPKDYGVPDEPKFDWLKEYPKGRSITELEIQYGALQRLNDSHAFFYLRDDPVIYKSIPEQFRKSFIDEDSQTREKLVNLKNLLKQSGKAVEYKCTWAGVFDDKPLMKGLESLRKRVLEDLWTAICKVYAPNKKIDVNAPTKFEAEDKLVLERSFHFSFMEARCKNYIGRKEVLDQLHKLVDSNQTVLVLGKPGSGKSALISKFIKEYIEKYPKVYVLPHFIGASPTSTNIRHILFRICSELVEKFKIEQTVTDDYKELLQLFPAIIEKAAFKSRILLVIDGLDQLNTTHRAHTLDWFPTDLPIKIVVSTQTITATSQIGSAAMNIGNQTSATSSISADGITYFIQETVKRRGFPELVVGPLSVKERRDIVKESLAEFRKKLDERPMNDQMRVLLKKTDADKPLYLIIACQELRVFGVYEQLTEKIKQMGPSIPQLLQEVLARAEQDHGKETIKTMLSLIVCARNGLLESEIVELLKRKSKNESSLPRALWSTIFSTVQWFLRPIDGSGESTLDFLYKEMTKAVKKRYFEHDLEHEIKSHKMLAEYFYQKAATAENTFNESNTRAISEVPYHLLRARVLKPLHGLLTNLKFIETKCKLGMVYDILSDYYDACEETIQWKGQERDTLEEFRKFVTANSHILSASPDLTFQQAMNSPDNSPVAYAAVSLAGTRNSLWMKWVNKPQMYDPVKMTIKLTDPITACSVSSDGTKFICATKDCIIRVFNAQTGMEINGLIGHSNWITSVSFSPDNQYILSSSWDQTCKVWDANTGLEQLTLSGHNRLVNCAKFSPDGKNIVSASWDCTLKVWENVQGKAIRTLRGHVKPVNTCEFSGDGKRIVSGSWDGVIKIWDALNYQELATLTGHTKSVRICHFSPNGKQIISAAMDASVRFWDSHAGKMITSLSGHSKPINTCSFSTDGQKLVSGGDDNMLIVWDAVLGKQSNSITCEVGWMNCINYSPDGKYLITSGSECFAALYDANDLTEIRRYLGHTRTVNCCIFNPVYHETIATASDDGFVKIWDRDTATCVMTLKGHRNSVNSCDFSPDGDFLVTSSDDFTVRVWDKDGQTVATLTNHTAVVKHAVFSPNGKFIASAGRDNVINLYNANTYKLLASFKGHLDWINFCSWSPDSKKIVSGSWDYNVKVWDVKKGKEKFTLVGHGSSISSCLFSKDGKKIFSSAYDGSLKVWDAKAGTEITSLIGHEKRVNSFAVAPNDFIASCSDDCTIRTWDPLAGIELSRHIGHGDVITGSAFIPNRETSAFSAVSSFEKILSASEDSTLRVWETHFEKEHIGHSKFINSVAFNRSGTMLASVSDDKTIKLWNSNTLKVVRTLVGHDEPIRDCAFSPDGTLVATVSDDKTGFIWDISKGKIKTTLSGHTNSIRSIAFSNDGQQVATGSWDHTARVWTGWSNVNSVILRGHTDWVTCLAFTPDGRQLVTGSCDNTLILWNIASQSISITFRGHNNWITALSVSPDGNVLLSGDYNGVVKGWDLRTGVELFSFVAHEKRVSSCRFSTDGALLFTGSYDGHVRAWSSTGKRQKVAEFTISNPCTSLSVSSKLLCIADSVGQLYVLNLTK